MLGHDAASKGSRGLGQIARSDLVDDAVGKRFRRSDRLAGDDHLQRLLGADKARQALRAASTRQQAELHFGQADARFRRGNPIVAGERQLEAAAERGAVQCRDHRLRQRLDRGDDLAQARGLRRLAEFGDVGTGEKRAPRAGDHHRIDCIVIADPAQRLGEPGADLVLQRIDRRIVGGDDRDPAIAAKIDAGVDIAHPGVPILPLAAH